MAKDSPLEKNITSKKELFTLSPGTLQKGVDGVGEDDDE
jgi:hypothetical protein